MDPFVEVLDNHEGVFVFGPPELDTGTYPSFFRIWREKCAQQDEVRRYMFYFSVAQCQYLGFSCSRGPSKIVVFHLVSL